MPHFSRSLREVGNDGWVADAKEVKQPRTPWSMILGCELRAHTPDSASFKFGVGYSMSPTNGFFSVTRTPAILLALVIFATNLSSAEWNEKVLHSFQGGTNDGAYPVGGVVFDSQGNLYGVLQAYGPGSCAPIGNECGAVFQLAPPAHEVDPWTETLIYKFQGKGANDGESPNGGLIIDSQGNLYGVTAYGGAGDCVLLGVSAGCGTVYKISPPKQKGGAWKETILYSFPTAKQGYLPNGDLVFDSAGNLYGATTFGGSKGITCDKFYGGQCGVVFKLSPPKTKGGKWTEKVLHAFDGIAAGAQFGDGANPNGGLVLDGKGDIYGTTYIGGYDCPHNSGQGCGAVFKLSPPTVNGGAWTECVLHRFKRDTSDGGNPMAGLRFDGVGKLYGTTLNGGAGQYGTVFSLRPPSKGTGSWVETVLHGFSDNLQGAGPEASLVFDAHGNLYGTTAIPTNRSAQGNVFRMRPPSLKGGAWSLSVVYTFTGNPDGATPSANLIFGSGGSIFGTTQGGGGAPACQGGCGTVFEVSP